MSEIGKLLLEKHWNIDLKDCDDNSGDFLLRHHYAPMTEDEKNQISDFLFGYYDAHFGACPAPLLEIEDMGGGDVIYSILFKFPSDYRDHAEKLSQDLQDNHGYVATHSTHPNMIKYKEAKNKAASPAPQKPRPFS